MPSNEDIREGRAIEAELRAAAYADGDKAFWDGLNIDAHKGEPWDDSWQGGWRMAARAFGADECTIRDGYGCTCGVCEMLARNGHDKEAL
jgi:hypothetical protein